MQARLRAQLGDRPKYSGERRRRSVVVASIVLTITDPLRGSYPLLCNLQAALIRSCGASFACMELTIISRFQRLQASTKYLLHSLFYCFSVPSILCARPHSEDYVVDSPCLHAKSMPPLRLSFPPVAFPSPKSAHLGKIPAVFPQMWVKKYRFGGNNLQKSPNVGKSQILTCNLLSGHLWLRRLMLRILLCSRQRALSAVHSHHPAGLTAPGLPANCCIGRGRISSGR